MSATLTPRILVLPYMRERFGVELELCPNECDDGTVAGRGKAADSMPAVPGYDDIFVRMKPARHRGPDGE